MQKNNDMLGASAYHTSSITSEADKEITLDIPVDHYEEVVDECAEERASSFNYSDTKEYSELNDKLGAPASHASSVPSVVDEEITLANAVDHHEKVNESAKEPTSSFNYFDIKENTEYNDMLGTSTTHTSSVPSEVDEDMTLDNPMDHQKELAEECTKEPTSSINNIKGNAEHNDLLGISATHTSSVPSEVDEDMTLKNPVDHHEEVAEECAKEPHLSFNYFGIKENTGHNGLLGTSATHTSSVNSEDEEMTSDRPVDHGDRVVKNYCTKWPSSPSNYSENEDYSSSDESSADSSEESSSEESESSPESDSDINEEDIRRRARRGSKSSSHPKPFKLEGPLWKGSIIIKQQKIDVNIRLISGNYYAATCILLSTSDHVDIVVKKKFTMSVKLFSETYVEKQRDNVITLIALPSKRCWCNFNRLRGLQSFFTRKELSGGIILGKIKNGFHYVMKFMPKCDVTIRYLRKLNPKLAFYLMKKVYLVILVEEY